MGAPSCLARPGWAKRSLVKRYSLYARTRVNIALRSRHPAVRAAANSESILLHAARLDRDRPLFDLAFDEGLQVGGGLALRRHDDEAEGMEALSEGRISHHGHQRRIELLHQRRRRALRQEY